MLNGWSLVVRTSVLLLAAVGGFQDIARAQGARELPGTYTLVTVDGHQLPYAPVEPGRPADAPPPPAVTASTFTVLTDSTFRMSMTYRMGAPGAERTMERQFNGTYKAEGAGYTFTWTNAGRTPVALRGDTLVLNNEGILFAYVRQAH